LAIVTVSGGGPLGVTITIDVSVAAATVSPVFPLTVPDVAVIVIGVALIVSAVANPPAAIVATVVFDDVHVAVEVRSNVDLSLYVPVAVNCVRVPTGTEAFAGVTAIDSSTGAVTVRAAFPATPFIVAEIVVDPCFKVVADPPAIVATVVSDEAHVAVAVRSLVVLLLYVARAVNAWGRPAATVAVAGVTAIDLRVGLPLLHPASSPAITTTTDNRRFFMGETPRSNLSFSTLRA
jgi:hypothetical protein